MEPFYPQSLKGVEFIRFRFHLEFQETFELTTEAALRLRRNLRQVGRTLFEENGPAGKERFLALFDPPLSPDPAALRRYQRPGPPFVILPPAPFPILPDEGDVLPLDVVFWGRGMQLRADFARVLQALGRSGWHLGEGRFDLVEIEAADAAGTFTRIWRPGRDLEALAPPVLEASWWVETARLSAPLELSFLTPARLIREGRPLFRPTFSRLFPFLLRRVTSVVHACCALELVDDPSPLLAAAATVKTRESSLSWTDWRTLEGEEKAQNLGGITGSVILEGPSLDEILWILYLASLMNVGKGASFGAGHFRLRPL